MLAADVPVLREVGGDYCVWFEQDNAEELCEAVEQNKKNSQYRKIKEIIDKYISVTWRECMDLVSDILKK